MTNKREYYHECRDMARTREGLNFLFATLREPSPYMRPIHLLIIRAAIRDIHGIYYKHQETIA